jgi:hypothetical protein
MAISVPGIVGVVAQPSSSTCWGTVYTMMKSWKDHKSYPPQTALGFVGDKYVAMFNQNRALPSSEFGPFMAAAKMTAEPMQNKTIGGWEKLLRNRGLLWIGTMNSLLPHAGLHSRIIQAINGDGTPAKTSFSIIDPDGGRRYVEMFTNFEKKYERAFCSVEGPYFQIRHF